jgi:F0F1-type ATP synthase membrane subunit b/b'
MSQEVTTAAVNLEHTDLGHGNEHESLSSLTWPAVNFLVFIAILIAIYKKKVQPALVARAINFQAEVARVQAEEDRFKREVESLQFQLAKIEDEEEQTLKTFIEQGKLSAEAITRQGLDEIAHLQAETSQTKANLVSQVEDQVRSAITERSMKLAAEKLKASLTPDMDKNLRAKVLQSI